TTEEPRQQQGKSQTFDTSQTIMKTTCLALGLLLLTVFHSYAIPLGLQTSPDSCCFSFFKVRVPFNKIDSIKKTHSGCPLTAFVRVSRGYRKPSTGLSSQQLWPQVEALRVAVILDILVIMTQASQAP
ncbi:unnamed protein product, partial [Coregonus sp. 'balchen']